MFDNISAKITSLFSTISTAQKPITIVSFYTEGGYYEEKASKLREQCDMLGIPHDIRPIAFPEGTNWAKICRAKVSFYRSMLHYHRSPIMWVDVDSVVLKSMDELAGTSYDIALFMRGFKFMPQYNSSVFTRNFHPGYLIFNYTPSAIEFLEECARVEEGTVGDFTDDYILEEAFRRTEARPRLLILSPHDILRPGEPESERALFKHGDSGNVKEYKGKVMQHRAPILEPASQKVVIEEMISAATKQGRRDKIIWLLTYQLGLNQDHRTLNKLLMLLEKDENETAIQYHLERAMEVDELRPFAIRYRLLRALRAKRWNDADALMVKLEAEGHPVASAFARSRMFRYNLDRRAEAIGISDADRVPMFWWEEPYPGNLGDIVNPYIIEKLTGVPPKFAPRGDGLLAIGSIIKFAKSGTNVWGSGSPHEEDVLAPDANYHAVRGPFTRSLVRRNGGSCPEIYGDPAWFLPIIYSPPVKKTHKTGLILHYTHETAALNVSDEIKRIGIRRLGYDQIENFLSELISCERIISTSLHGVIIAQAYGIPACLATVSDSRQQIHGDGIKFRDYYASIGIDDVPKAVDLSTFTEINEISLDRCAFMAASKKINLTSLAKAAPFDVLPQFLEAAGKFDAE